MFPVLFTIGKFPVSSFGLFTALAFIYSVFLAWRLARASEVNEEKVLDLALLSLFGGLIGARLYFVIEHFDFFALDLGKIFQIAKYPGFSFWGSFLGGWITLYYFSRRFRLDFWQIADIASVAFLGGLVLGSIGCLLGGCSAGIRSDFLGIDVIGLVGKRFPIQGVEAIFYLFYLPRVWNQATHFHLRGKIVSSVLIYVGAVKFITEFFRAQPGSGFLLSISMIVLGIAVYYKIINSQVRFGRRNILNDLKSLLEFSLQILVNGQTRSMAVAYFKKTWYNHKIAWSWSLRNFKKNLHTLSNKILRRMRVKSIHN